MELLNKIISSPWVKIPPAIIPFIAALLELGIFNKKDSLKLIIYSVIFTFSFYFILLIINNYSLSKKIDGLNKSNEDIILTIQTYQEEMQKKDELLKRHRKFTKDATRAIKMHLNQSSPYITELNINKNYKTKDAVGKVIASRNSIEYEVKVLEDNIYEWQLF